MNLLNQLQARRQVQTHHYKCSTEWPLHMKIGKQCAGNGTIGEHTARGTVAYLVTNVRPILILMRTKRMDGTRATKVAMIFKWTTTKSLAPHREFWHHIFSDSFAHRQCTGAPGTTRDIMNTNTQTGKFKKMTCSKAYLLMQRHSMPFIDGGKMQSKDKGSCTNGLGAT